MSGMQVMIAVKSGVIRQEGKTRLMIRKGVTTAHEGSDIVRDHPHLWGRLDVTFPSDDIVSAAAEDAGLSHSQALRDLYEGLVERGYDIQEGTAAEDVPAQVVALAFSAIDHPQSGARPEGPVGTEPGCTHPECILDHPHDGPAQLAPADPGETGGPDTMPDAVVDPGTKEGRAAIRTWAEDHGFEVSSSGPLRQEVLDAWAADQGGRA